MRSNSARISDYALIGDGRSCALVSRTGSLEWLCWPRFDSPSIFAAALDRDRGGHWRVSPVGAHRVHRGYLPDSNVLVTTFEVPGGELRVTDFMSILGDDEKHSTFAPEHELVRIVECTRGEIETQIDFRPAPRYGRKSAVLRSVGKLGIRFHDGPHLYNLRSDGPLTIEEPGAAVGRWHMRAGERHCLSLTFDTDGPAVLPPLSTSADRAERTARWWRDWARLCSYAGPYREQVVRGLLVLKLLSYAPSGAIIAAATTSFPERIGGDLNWDYRFCWLRDASLTMRVFLSTGYEAEASAFAGWLLHSTRLTRPELHVLYDVHGRVPRDEYTVDAWRGLQGSRPVRIGNAAGSQLQLDTYGEVIDAVTHLCRRGHRLDGETQRMLRHFGEYVCENWQRPDQGIWEPREPPKHHTHSRVLCWTALQRLLELHRDGHLRRLPVALFEEQQRLIRAEVEQRGWNPRLRSYTQLLDGDTVDAALLLMSWYGFVDAQHPRMRATFDRVRDRLQAGPGLLWRNQESRMAGEGAFGICGFWAAEFLAQGGGSLTDAQRCLEQQLPYGNDVGLFAEEIDPETSEPLGNFPQAFTHVGLISAALAIEERRRQLVPADEGETRRAAAGQAQQGVRT